MAASGPVRLRAAKRCQNLGPTQKVVEVLSQWLGTIDYDEVETSPRYERSNPG